MLTTIIADCIQEKRRRQVRTPNIQPGMQVLCQPLNKYGDRGKDIRGAASQVVYNPSLLGEWEIHLITGQTVPILFCSGNSVLGASQPAIQSG